MSPTHGPDNERFRRLTPREAHVLLLLLEGTVSTQDIAEVLGVSRAVVSGMRQSIRRKLGVPRHADLRDFVDSVPGLRQLADRGAPADRSAPPDDRRRHLVLRAALRDLQGLAARLEARADALRVLGDSGGLDRSSARAEADEVDGLAGRLRDLFADGVSRARSDPRLQHELDEADEPMSVAAGGV